MPLIIGSIIIVLLVIAIVGIFSMIALSPRKLWTPGTSAALENLIEQEKEIYKKINKEINNAGIINIFFIKRKLGPLYDWYASGIIQ